MNMMNGKDTESIKQKYTETNELHEKVKGY